MNTAMVFDEILPYGSSFARRDLDANLASTWSDRGVAKYQPGDFAGAIADHTQAIKRKPNYAEAYGDRGAARLAQGDIEGALADANRALALTPLIGRYLS
jgi:tetratricopeptide (TPR) repeat protein